MCLRAMFVLPASVCVIPVNELVTCISHSVPRYFCSPAVSYLLLLLQFFFPPLVCPCFPLSRLCLFTFAVDGNHRRSKMQPGTKLFSPFLQHSLLFSPLHAEQTGERACLGFPNCCPCRGSLESNPTIIAGWRGLAEAGERKGAACYGAFQTDPIDGL